MTNKTNETLKFGEHIIFDAYGCDYKALNSREVCVETLNQLVKIAKMHKLIDPYIIEAVGNDTLGGKDPGGFSGFVIIEESHISLHTFAKRGFITLDLYSCKPFEHKGVIEYLIKTFKPENYDVLKMDRGLKYPSKNLYK